MKTNIIKRQGICIQIGLMFSVEYLYLTQYDWKEVWNEEREVNQIHPSLLEKISDDPWLYYGIDRGIYSVATFANRFPQGNWICANVHPTNTGMNPYAVDDVLLPYEGNPIIWIPNMSLSDIVSSLGLTYIDALKMDIEGAEAAIFESYDWKVKPTFISVEIHSFEPFDAHRKRVMSCLFNQGYALVNEVPTNKRSEYPTVEGQFLLTS